MCAMFVGVYMGPWPWPCPSVCLIEIACRQVKEMENKVCERELQVLFFGIKILNTIQLRNIEMVWCCMSTS